MMQILWLILVVMIWEHVRENRENMPAVSVKAARRTAQVLTAVALGCLLGMLWDILELDKSVGDYGILLYWLAGLVPEPYREAALEWADFAYEMICVIAALLAVTAYQFYMGRHWLRILGKPGRVLVPGASLCAVWYLYPRAWAYVGYCVEYDRDLFDLRNAGTIVLVITLGILLGLISLLAWRWRTGKQDERDITYSSSCTSGYFAALTVVIAALLGMNLLAGSDAMWRPLPAAAFGIVILSGILRLLWNSRDRIRVWYLKWKPRIGKAIRIGIVVAAVVAGYCVFSVQVNGNYQSEYYAEQITVTHHWADSEDKTMYCVDFTERELRYYVLHSNGNERLCWTKELTDEALDAFVETCNEGKLLGREYASVGRYPGEIPGDYCLVYTYSDRGERLVFDGSGYYEDKDALMKTLDKAFYDLTGFWCLSDS